MSSNEKAQDTTALLPTTTLPSSASAPPTSRFRAWLACLRLTLLALFLSRYLVLPLFIPSFDSPISLSHKSRYPASHKSSSCAQAEPIFPQSFDVSALVEGQTDRIAEWLSGSVEVPTEIFDVMGEVGVDPRWEVFYKFADYLEEAFPLVHKHLTRTRVVTHALVFEWQGSDSSLKPLLLTGHQDVVPVLNATRGLWTHDPFGGEYDKETGLVWGRGSIDDKSGTIGVLSAVELLLESGKFEPTRTVILAFGIDEETGGKVGAYNLGIWLEEKYGKDSMAMLVDEGMGMSELYGQYYAAPAVGEKGYLDVELRMETLGGHSSVPPPHTGIGFLSLLIAALEKHPHEPYLNPESPLITMLECAADYSPDMPSDLKKAVYKLEDSLTGKSKVDKKALEKVTDWWVEGSAKDGVLALGLGKAMISTTQAVDIINGGVKVNALPEVVTAVVNHRISLASSVKDLQGQITHVLKPVAKKYNLALEAWGDDVQLEGCTAHADAPKKGKIVVSVAYNSSLDPAPVSPFTVDSAAWRLLSGTVKSVYSTRPAAKLSAAEASKEVMMAPSISTGNTDTKRYWNLGPNIYRFAYLDLSDGLSGVHTVDEHIRVGNFVEQVRWFMNFIVNVDESREL